MSRSLKYALGARSHSKDQMYSDFIFGGYSLSNKSGKVSHNVLASHLSMRTAVYAIGQEFGRPIKIGFSRKPRGRLVDLQIAVAEPLRFHHVYWLSSKAEATKLEAECHRFLTEVGSHVRGEWFDLDGPLAGRAIQAGAQNAGCKLVSHSMLIEKFPTSRDPLQGCFW